MFVATLIADGTLNESLVREWVHQFATDWTAGRPSGSRWIDERYAFDMDFSAGASFGKADCAHLADGLSDLAEGIALAQGGGATGFDVVVQPMGGREKTLLVADMDSTMITVECIDELADYAGLKAEVAAVTEAAMRGEVDFEAALDARVALLAGLEAGVIDRCLAERVRIMPGAKALVRTMRARGGRCVLVSGGFTRFAEPVAAEIGFDRAIANRLEIEGGRLTGRVDRPIVGAATKEAVLRGEAADLSATMAVGDGANDLPMIRAADAGGGLGVAYRAKPVVAAGAGARIVHGDLTALLYAQGIARQDWAE